LHDSTYRTQQQRPGELVLGWAFRKGQRVVKATRVKLRCEILAVVHQTLGSEFDVRSVTFRSGSIEIFVVIGAVYYAVSRYKNFVESIELATSQIAGAVQRFFNAATPMGSVNVVANWQPGPGLVRLETAERPKSLDTGWAYPLLWYVILSHAALLSLSIYLLVEKSGLAPVVQRPPPIFSWGNK